MSLHGWAPQSASLLGWACPPAHAAAAAPQARALLPVPVPVPVPPSSLLAVRRTQLRHSSKAAARQPLKAVASWQLQLPPLLQPQVVPRQQQESCQLRHRRRQPQQQRPQPMAAARQAGRLM